MKNSTRVPNSLNLLVAIKIAVIEPVLQPSMTTVLAEVPRVRSSKYGNITCRVWVKEALLKLDELGYIKLIKTVEWIEDDAILKAGGNRPRGVRTVISSSGSEA
ncbi:hypothetical protein BU16DRAFT_169152 [Lophium mytilinum]|uniref:Uncharacterized protein n=1 Tax=Lophium mytilinum TaxID=390894 RepID=A0A6A6QCC9_9PEZI|nr:hypothetical protein BU16DRAFT_169152 [Lophium mytilinum]